MQKFEFPLKYFRDNLIFNAAGEVWAVYELQGFTYDFRSHDMKNEMLTNLSRLLSNIGNHAKIFIYPVAKRTRIQFDKLRRSVNGDDIEAAAVSYFNDIERYLQEKTRKRGNINDYQFFLTVKMKDVALEKSIKELALDLPRTVNSLLNIGSDYIVKDELDLYKNASKTLLRTLSSSVALIEANPDQVQWMLARMMVRGMGKNTFMRVNANGKAWNPSVEESDVRGKEAIIPRTNELRTLFEGRLEHNKRYIEVNTDDGESIQSFLQFSHIPDGVAFPGGEYLKVLYDFPIASEICITIRPVEYKKAIEKISRQADKIEGQIKHTIDSGESIPEDLREGAAQIQELEETIKENRSPLLETSISICVSGKTKEAVDKDVAMLRNFYKDRNYRLERAVQDQLMSFFQFIPGSPIYNTDYKFQLPPKTLAGSMFLATRRLGDSKGSYIGSIGIVDKPVYFTPFLAPLKNRSAACFFMGTLGGGKSFNSNLITYSTIMQGARALIIDPKGERGEWINELPELSDHMTITTLTSKDEDKGKLDPFNIYRDNPKEAGELARSILKELYKIEDKSPTDVILAETIRTVIDGVESQKTGKILPPSMELVYIMLQKVPERNEEGHDNTEYQKAARALARLMKATKEIGMASLLFGTGREKGLSFNAKVNILQVDGLNMPDPALKKEEYNESQTLSTVLMIPISSFAKRFASKDKLPKTILLDESWALRQTTEGKNLFNFLARAGRSLNCCTIFIGHSVEDVDDKGLKAAITFKFCFKVNTSEEAAASLRFMELEVTEDNLEVLMKMPNGHALFKDLDGNVDIVKFDAVKEHIAFAFNTNPDKYRRAS